MTYMDIQEMGVANGLGKIIETRISLHNRFVDLFCGSSAVTW